MIKKLLVCFAFALTLMTCVGCDVSSMSTLNEISRPYVGEYRCEKLLLGGKDLSDRFESVKLNLAYDGAFELSYRSKEGNEGNYSGEYTVSPAGDEITLSSKNGSRSVSQSFPIEKGTILIDWKFGFQLLHAEFCLP